MPEQAFDERWILVFDSIHHVLAAERALLGHGLWCDLIPTPRDIRTDCGMVIELRPAERHQASGVVQSLARPPVAVYQRTVRGHEHRNLDEPPA